MSLFIFRSWFFFRGQCGGATDYPLEHLSRNLLSRSYLDLRPSLLKFVRYKNLTRVTRLGRLVSPVNLSKLDSLDKLDNLIRPTKYRHPSLPTRLRKYDLLAKIMLTLSHTLPFYVVFANTIAPTHATICHTSDDTLCSAHRI